VSMKSQQCLLTDGFILRPKSQFDSVDPAPPYTSLTVEELKPKLLDTSLPMFERYRALFALREKCSSEAVEVFTTRDA